MASFRNIEDVDKYESLRILKLPPESKPSKCIRFVSKIESYICSSAHDSHNLPSNT